MMFNKYKKYLQHIILIYGAVSLIFFCQQALSQGLPTELMDLSFEDINTVEIGSELGPKEKSPEVNVIESDNSKWHIGYDYRRIRFEGYRDGNNDISNEELLRKSGDTPSNDNFPVLPDVIIQQLHLVKLGYDFTPHMGLSLFLPYVQQSTDHISSFPGFDQFILTSEGLGDVSTVFSYQINRLMGETMILSLGVSFPTGSIDEKGDTPRPSPEGVEQLPYSMQLGSGTYDIPISMSYAKRFSSSIVGAQVLAKIRTGMNDRNYRLGNRLLISLWYSSQFFSIVQPYVKAVYQNWGRIVGEDEDLKIAGDYPYPAPVTNPNLYGGQKINAVVGLKIQLPKGNMYGHAIDLEYGTPVYQYLNGPQSQEDQQMRIGWTLDF